MHHNDGQLSSSAVPEEDVEREQCVKLRYFFKGGGGRVD